MSRSCKYSPRLILVSCLLLIAASQTNTYSQTPAFLKFKVKVVDCVTGKPKSKYFLGETVSVVFTITNQSRRPRIVANLQDTYIPYTLVSEFENKKTKTVEDGRGGTGGSYVGGDGTVYWTESAPRKLTLGPGQSVSVRIDDLRGMYSNKLEDGYHTLTASYGRLQSRVSFRIVIDEAKTIPLLEKLATAPLAKNGDETDKLWAEDQLREIRLPSISGMVTDTAGQPLDHVDIKVSEENLADETRA